MNNGWYRDPKFVKLGMAYRYSQNDTQGRVYGIKRMYQHPDYNMQSHANDIGLLKLNDTVKLDQFICSVCLPTQQLEDTSAVTTGFAFTNYNPNQVEYLLKYHLQQRLHDECNQFSEHYALHSENMVCFGQKGDNIVKCGVSIS